MEGDQLCSMVTSIRAESNCYFPSAKIVVAINMHKGVLQGPQIEIRMGEVLHSTVVGRPVAAAPSSQCSRCAISVSIVMPE